MSYPNSNRNTEYDSYPKPIHQNVIVDGVLRWPSTGLKVLVVGAGPGGYLTAIECWRKGHEVEIIERSASNSPIGDVVFIGPSALVTLKYYPTMLQDYASCTWDAVCSFRRVDGTPVSPPLEFEYNRTDVPHHAAWPLRVRTMVSRPGLAEMFSQQCQRLGIPVTFGVNIVDYIENTGSATAKAADGGQYSAHIVVAADGLGTKSHQAVMGQTLPAVPTGFAICRIFFRLDKTKNADLIKRLAGHVDRPDLRTHSGEHFHCIIITAEDCITIGCTMQDDEEAKESWAETITSEQFISKLPNTNDWDPLIIEVFRNIPENSIIKWQLCWRDPQPKWTSDGGRIIQLGDSAHAFIPSSISGATTTLEDALSLAECLRLAGKDDAHIGTKVYELLRLRRTTVLQRLGFNNRREMHREGGAEEMMKTAAKSGPMGLGKWIWTHNPENYATENFTQARAHLEKGAPFEHTNLPKGFKWEPWCMQDEVEKEKQGMDIVDLKLNGDWSIN